MFHVYTVGCFSGASLVVGNYWTSGETCRVVLSTNDATFACKSVAVNIGGGVSEWDRSVTFPIFIRPFKPPAKSTSWK